jgi:vitamin B12 transporter
MRKLSIIVTSFILLSAPLVAEEVLSGTISISRATTTANRAAKPVKLKKVPSKTNIITAKTIKKRGYRTVAEALSHEAGIAISSAGGAGQPVSIFVRGMSSSDVLVMVDGEPMVDYTQPSPAPFGLENINMDNVKRIEVIKGAQSGVWGANAVAGVVNIITTGAKKDYASIYGGYGSHNTKEGGFTLSDAGKHGSFFLSHKLFSTDGISAFAPITAEADGYSYEDTYFKAKINDDDGSTFGVFVHHNKSDFDYDSGFPADPNDTLGKGSSNMTNMGLTYRYDAGGRFAFQSRASITSFNRKLQGAFGPFDTAGDRHAISAMGTYRFAKNNKLSAGFERSSISGSTSFAPATGFSNNAVFANYTYTFDDLVGAETTVNAALRYDRFDKFANKATYRFGIKRNYNILDGLHTSVNIYSAYKAPSLYQISNASATLKPEYTTGYDISAGYKNLLNITYFKNSTTDKITNTTVWPALPSYANTIGSQEISGVEISGGYALGDTGLYLGANMTHLFQDHLVKRAQNSANLFLDYHFASTSTFGLSLHYVGDRDAFDGTRLKAYKTLNATLSTRLGDHLDLSLGAKNILNSKYQTAKGYNTAGRSVYAKVKYTF